jgi:predicted Fe-Mo cluster-binding NifX family protein
MKICIPVETNKGLDSHLDSHFGSSAFFLLYNTQTCDIEIISNHNSKHEHGMCNPLEVLASHDVQIVICRGMGARAVQRLQEAKVDTFCTDAQTVRDALIQYENRQLKEINAENACKNHVCKH